MLSDSFRDSSNITLGFHRNQAMSYSTSEHTFQFYTEIKKTPIINVILFNRMKRKTLF